MWLQLMAFYSISLIAFGVGLKAHLSFIVCGGSYATSAYGYGYGGGNSNEGSSYGESSYGGSPYEGSSYSSSYTSYGDRRLASSSGPNSLDIGSHGYCLSVPTEYTQLLCGAFIAQYIALELSLPLHEGYASYMQHFFDYSKFSAAIIMSMKLLTVAAAFVLAFIPKYVTLAAHEILLVIFAIVCVQGVVQYTENQIVHDRRTAQGTVKREHNKNIESFYRGKVAGWVSPPGTPAAASTPVSSKSPREALASPKNKLSSNKKMPSVKDTPGPSH